MMAGRSPGHFYGAIAPMLPQESTRQNVLKRQISCGNLVAS
jgi:hypothetical protein